MEQRLGAWLERFSSCTAGTAARRGSLMVSKSRFRIGTWDLAGMKPGEVGTVTGFCSVVVVGTTTVSISV